MTCGETGYVHSCRWLDAWDKHLSQCEARLRELAPLAKSLGLTIAVEDHLDFTVEEQRHKEHMQYEQDRMAQCIAYLKGLLDDVSAQGSA